MSDILYFSPSFKRAETAITQKYLPFCKYVVAEYDKVKRIIMPAGKNHILYVTTTSTFDHNKVVRKVRSFR